MQYLVRTIWLLITGCCCLTAVAQDSAALHTVNPQKYFEAVSNKAETFNHKVDKYTEKTLDKVLKHEKKMYSKLKKTDSILAKRVFAYAIDSLERIKSSIGKKTAGIRKLLAKGHFPYLDSLNKSTAFFEKYKDAFQQAGNIKAGLSQYMDQLEHVEDKLQSIDNIQTFLDDQKRILEDHLKAFPELSGYIRKISKEAYYYKAQVEEYKSVFSDPDKWEKTLVKVLQRMPAFQSFMEKFTAGGLTSGGGGVTMPSFASSSPPIYGIPSRQMVQQAIQANFNGTVPDISSMVSHQVGDAQAMMDQLQQKLNNLGIAGKEMPDFTPNTQKVKSFQKRLEYGADLQFGKAAYMFPSTANIGLQLGYKLNDKSSIGIGAAYKLGMGSGWKNIRFSHEGIALRSFIDWKLKGSFYIRGGSEWNYNSSFKNIEQLKSSPLWQQSALLGLSKKYKIAKKINGSLQLMYDFLYKEHIPNTQAFIFRVGYGL